MITFITGGARSGKSRLATRLAAREGGPVRLVATARADDEEMTLRIEDHRRHRPGSWTLVEEPIHLDTAIETAVSSETLLIDCVTLWISNLMVERDDATILAMLDDVVAGIVSRSAHTIVVSNEVGGGLVPMHSVGRRFRDLQGRANQVLAAVADTSFLVVAGRVLQLGDSVDAV